MKKIFMTLLLIVFATLLLFSEQLSFKQEGLTYYIDNPEYSYEIIDYTLKYSANSLSELESDINVNTSIMQRNVEKINESTYVFYFSFLIYNYTYNNGEIIYLYSFEDKINDSNVTLKVNNIEYVGRVQSEGPYEKNELKFSIVFSDVTENIENISYEILMTGLKVTSYERK